jgi:hypothetical protein
MAGVPADVSRRFEEEEGNLANMEQEDVVNSAQHGAGSVPAGDSSANLPEGHKGSAGERLNDVNGEIVTKPMLRVMLEAAAVRIVPLPRLAGAETTAVVKTIETQKPERGP